MSEKRYRLDVTEEIREKAGMIPPVYKDIRDKWMSRALDHAKEEVLVLRDLAILTYRIEDLIERIEALEGKRDQG